MEQILADFRKALSEAEKRGAVQYKAEVKVNSALDMAVLHYKQEKEKQERKARLFSY
jgi:hypothetical protein